MNYLVDTNLLILLIVGLTNANYISRHKCTRNEYGIKEFQKLKYALSDARTLICTPHVLTETSNLLRQCSEPMRSEIMHCLSRYIEKAEEKQVVARDIVKANSFLRLGLTDAAIASLDPASLCILTVDSDLYVECARLGISAINMTPQFYEF